MQLFKMKEFLQKNIYSFFIAEWTYVDMRFGKMQAIGTLSYPLSFLTIIMAPTTWHFQSYHDSTRLTLWMQVKAMPFFLSSMWMKLWALSTATSFSSLLASQLGTSRVICFGPLLIALV